MNILALGDPHGVLPKRLSEIIKENKIDMIICVGDIAPVPIVKNPKKTYETLQTVDWRKFRKKMDDSYKKVLEKICSFDLPVLVLKGNMYSTTNEARSFVRNLHSKYKNLVYKMTGKIKIKGQDFILLDMIYEPYSHKRYFSKNYTQKIKSNINRANKLNKMLKELDDPILVTHAPPYKILDKTVTNLHIGSKILLSAISKYPPKMVLCGHVHEGKGTKKTLGTTIHNLGFRGDYKILKV